MDFELNSEISKKVNDPSHIVISRTGAVILILSFIIALLGLFYTTPIFLIPGLTITFSFLYFVGSVLINEVRDFEVEIKFPSTQIKAKQFLIVGIEIITEVNFTGMVEIDVSDGLFSVVNSQQKIIDSQLKKSTSFLFYAPRRGKERVRAIRLTYGGIRGMFYVEKRIEINQEIILLPQAQRVNLPWTQKQQILDRLVTELTTTRKGRGSDFLSLRDFYYGDEVRHIHWKASAKFGKLITKEFEEPVSLRFLIVIDKSLFMAGPKLEFALSAAIELSEVIQRSNHTANVLVHGDMTTRLVKLDYSITALRRLSLDLHRVQSEGTIFNYLTLQRYILQHKLQGAVVIIITDMEQEPSFISSGMALLKPFSQAIFFNACSTTGFGTLALSKTRDFNMYNLDQVFYRREVIEPRVKNIYEERAEQYEQVATGERSIFHLIESYNTNILLELSKSLRLFSKARRR